MLRTIFWYAAGWTYLVVTMPVLYRIKYLEKKGRTEDAEALANRFSMTIARVLFRLTGSSVEVEGAERIPDGPVLFVSNHQSHMDSAVIHGFIDKPKGFIADKDAGRIPIIRTWMKYMKCIFIDRSNARRNIRSLDTGIRLLKQGHSLVIYPEGRINASSRLLEFKKGCLKLAAKAGVPVVPVTIRDSFRLMNREGFGIGSARIRCIISDPIYITGHDDKNEAAQIKKVRDIIAKNLM
jgi:1-acyl-sn-glycerol-3-phosphate acyltransferase